MLRASMLLSASALVLIACTDDGAPGGDELGESDSTTSADTGSDTSTESSSEDDTSTDAGSDTSTDTGGEAEPIYPVPDWQSGAPEDHGLSSEGLAALAEVAEGFDSNCLLVVHDGLLIGEWYWNGYDKDTDQPNVFSVTKSVSSALVGIAQADGSLDVEDDAAAYIDAWIGTDSEGVTIRNLISNNSGRHWSFTSDYVELIAASDQTQFAVELGQDQPANTWWEYNNAAIQTLERVLSVATGEDVEAFAQARLFEPIGMGVSMTRDGAGNPQTYQGLSASCRDLARFGYLFLREGEWAGGVQVVPAQWVAESTAPSTNLNTAYGYMWWLNVDGHWVLPSAPLRDEGDGKLLPDAPESMFSAVGALGQVVAVEPESGYVLVRLGDAADLQDLTGFAKLEAIWAAFDAAKL